MKSGRLANRKDYPAFHPSFWRHLLKPINSNSSSRFHLKWLKSTLKVTDLLKKVVRDELRLLLTDIGGALPFSEGLSSEVSEILSQLNNIIVNEGSSSIHICLEGSSLDTGTVQFPCLRCSSANWSCSSLRAYLCLHFICAGGFRPWVLHTQPAGDSFWLWLAWVKLQLMTKKWNLTLPKPEVICCPLGIAGSKATAIRFVWHNKQK